MVNTQASSKTKGLSELERCPRIITSVVIWELGERIVNHISLRLETTLNKLQTGIKASLGWWLELNSGKGVRIWQTNKLKTVSVPALRVSWLI